MFILFLCLCLFLSNVTQASHLVGGDISYECLGTDPNNSANNLFRVELHVYRDYINANPNATFDSPATLTVYTQTGNGPSFYNNFFLYHSSPVNIPVNLNTSCVVIPPTIGVEEAVYQETISLPRNTTGYYLVYQRCCRNGTINNILNPGTTGSTYSIFISGLAQSTCNSSPTFNDFPPVAICKDIPFSFDHSAMDKEGHQLVYRFCTPKKGGTDQDPKPLQASAPPFSSVDYAPGFSFNYPISSTPIMSINPNTGLLTGTPTQLGQYVVGICVDEFDANGNLLSTTLRDFQFNVANCEVKVDAKIQADDISLNQDTFLVRSCGSMNVFLQNLSTQAAYITDYRWEIDLNNGNILTATSTDLLVNFPGYDTYTGLLIANPTATDCNDTAFLKIIVAPEIFSNFINSPNLCDPGPVNFNDQTTFAGNNFTVDWQWDFGDGNSSSQSNPSHQYTNPGAYRIELEVTDNNGCKSDTFVNIDWFPASALQIDAPKDICLGNTVNFLNNSLPWDNSYVFSWDFGDGNTSNDFSPSHQYAASGIYNYTVKVLTSTNCEDSLTQSIEIIESAIPQYNFSFDPCIYDTVLFANQSILNSNQDPIVSWFWEFGDGTTSTSANPRHLYNLAGSYTVKMRIEDVSGCFNVDSQVVDFFPAPEINIAISSDSGCAPFPLLFDNQSFPINGYSLDWNFGDGGSDTAISPTYIYQNGGEFPVHLHIVSPIGCTADYRDTIKIFRTPQSQFRMDYDLCSPDSIQFFNQSTASGDAVIAQYNWTLGDGTTLDTANNFRYLYQDTSIYEIILTVRDSNNCADTSMQTLKWLPKPIYPIDLSNTKGCVKHLINSPANSPYPLPSYTLEWSFGDGTTSLEDNPSHWYTQPGRYQRKVIIRSTTSCVDSFSSEHLVLEVPTSKFDYTPKTIYSSNPLVNFSDLSIKAGMWEWDFGNGDSKLSSFEGDISYSYDRDTGWHEVQLVVTHKNGCTDTSSQWLDIIPQITFFLPNAFTPDNDGLNDGYRGKGLTQYLKRFEMSIYNRWGERVFESREPEEEWNGRVNNQGQKCPAGVYVVVVRYEGPRGEKEELRGFATIIY